MTCKSPPKAFFGYWSSISAVPILSLLLFNLLFQCLCVKLSHGLSHYVFEDRLQLHNVLWDKVQSTNSFDSIFPEDRTMDLTIPSKRIIGGIWQGINGLEVV